MSGQHSGRFVDILSTGGGQRLCDPFMCRTSVELRGSRISDPKQVIEAHELTGVILRHLALPVARSERQLTIRRENYILPGQCGEDLRHGIVPLTSMTMTAVFLL